MNSHETSASPRRRAPSAFPLAVISLLAVCAVWVVSGTAQSTEQSVPSAKKGREVRNEIPRHVPIKIKLKNFDKVKDLDNDGWLADLEIEVQNTGTKPIYFLSFFLEFVDVKRDSGANIGYEFEYGRTKLVEIDQRATPEDVPIPPGGTHVFKLHQDYVDGWNWYRTQVEQKPQPKIIKFFFSTLSHGDGTGYVTNGGVFVSVPPTRRSSYEKESGGGGRVIPPAAGCRPARPPDPTFKLASYFLPAAFSPVNFFSTLIATPATGATPPTRATARR